jgi:hypothetical protein
VNDFERRLKRLGEDAERELPGEMRPRPESLTRIRLRRRLLAGSVALCSAAVVAGGVVVAGAGGTDRRTLPPAHERVEQRPAPDHADECALPFAATYVPPGFRARPKEAPGGGTASRPGVVAHFAGRPGRVIDVFVGERAFVPTERIRIEVLGRHAVLGAVHEGYSVDFRTERCDYQLVGYGVTREELRDFAEGLVAVTPPAGTYFGAVWPEDTVREARRGCAGDGRGEPITVATDFASEELRWDDVLWEVEERKRGDATVTLRPQGERLTDPRTDPGVRVWMENVLPGCWSVVSVSPLAQRRLDSLSVGVNGREANIVFERYGATTASVEFGYGTHRTLTHWHRESGEEITRLHVNGVSRSTGHFLVLLRDEDGDPFAAIGRPMPPGDFAAG